MTDINTLIAVKWEDSEQIVIDECTPDMVWRPKQDISHEKRCLLDATYDGNVPALPPLGPEHPRLLSPSPNPPNRPTSPHTFKPTYDAPRPTRIQAPKPIYGA